MDWDLALEAGSIGTQSGLLGDRMADVSAAHVRSAAWPRALPLAGVCGRAMPPAAPPARSDPPLARPTAPAPAHRKLASEMLELQSLGPTATTTFATDPSTAGGSRGASLAAAMAGGGRRSLPIAGDDLLPLEELEGNPEDELLALCVGSEGRWGVCRARQPADATLSPWWRNTPT